LKAVTALLKRLNWHMSAFLSSELRLLKRSSTSLASSREMTFMRRALPSSNELLDSLTGLTAMKYGWSTFLVS
jgi:hypothetical protein